MTSLLKVRDTVVLHERIEFSQLCRKLDGSPAMVLAMLERLELMGCVEKVDDTDNGCLSGSCKGCPETSKNCTTLVYKAKRSHGT